MWLLFRRSSPGSGRRESVRDAFVHDTCLAFTACMKATWRLSRGSFGPRLMRTRWPSRSLRTQSPCVHISA